MEYVLFKREEQIAFMKLVKSNSNQKWVSIAKSLNLTRGMMFHYLSGKSKIPVHNYVTLCGIANLPVKNKRVIDFKNKTAEITEPKLEDWRLAELLGILAGDGHISKINYEVSITGHRILDRDYLLTYVSKIFRNLFGVNVKFKEQSHNNTLRCVINSKLMHSFLIKHFYLPVGKKKNKLHIPAIINQNEALLKYYLRGLFDTDGSVYIRRKNSLVVTIASVDPPFLDEVKSAFIRLGYSPSVSGKNLCIYNQSQIKRFFNEIGSSNRKHQKRYDNFIK